MTDIGLRSTSSADSEFVYQTKKAALGKYIAETWGWEEQYQRQYHTKDFHPSAIQIVTLEDKDVGWVVVTRSDDQIQISELYILPEYQRRRIGSHLVSKLLEEAREKHIPVKLGVLKVNPARHFYEKLGFGVVGETETHYQMEVSV
jgi:ribosomal protein S18 acetylase RimI-like enzyme